MKNGCGGSWRKSNGILTSPSPLLAGDAASLNAGRPRGTSFFSPALVAIVQVPKCILPVLHLLTMAVMSPINSLLPREVIKATIGDIYWIFINIPFALDCNAECVLLINPSLLGLGRLLNW